MRKLAMKIRTRKASSKKQRTDITKLEDVPNIGKSIADDLRQLGVRSPGDLRGRDPYQLYEELCEVTGQRHDPCLLDTFIAAVRFMEGGPNKPWWKYTAERKRAIAARTKR
jgi:Pathogenicity locus